MCGPVDSFVKVNWGQVLGVFVLALSLCACGESKPGTRAADRASESTRKPDGNRSTNVEAVDYYFLGDLKMRAVKATTVSSERLDAAVRISARALSDDGAPVPLGDTTVMFGTSPDASRSVELAIPVPVDAGAPIEVVFQYLNDGFETRAEARRRVEANGTVDPAPR